MTSPAYTTPTTTPRRGHAIDPDRARFYRLIGWDGGRVELVAGTNHPGDPDKIDLLVWTKATHGQGAHTREWVAPAELSTLDRKAERLAAEWGNVYVSIGTVDATPNPWRPGQMRYSRAAQRPRRGFVLDDVLDLAALPLAPTWANETSPGNYQVGYTCTELLSPAEAHQLASAAAWLMGADASGVDPQQLIRLPNTLNTKAKCAGSPGGPGVEPEGWRVRLRVEGQPYTRAQLRRAFGITGAEAQARAGSRSERQRGDVAGDATAEPWRSQSWRNERAAEVALWRPLARPGGGGGLLAEDGCPRGFTLKARARRLQAGERNLHADGRPDESKDVYQYGQGLVIHGYADGPGLALLEHFAYTYRPAYVAARGSAEAWIDLCRIWHRVCAELGDARRVRPAKLPAGVQAQDAPEVPRSPRGRPVGAQGRQVERLAPLLIEGREYTAEQLAAVLDVTPRSVNTYLQQLRSAERLETKRTGRGFRVTRSENKSAPPVEATEAQQDAAQPATIGTEVQDTPIGNIIGFSASQCGEPLQEITPPAPCDVREAAPPPPAAGSAAPAPAAPAPRRREPARFDPQEWARRWRGPEEVKADRRRQAASPEPRPAAPAVQPVLIFAPPPHLAELAALLELRDDDPAEAPAPQQPAGGCAPPVLPSAPPSAAWRCKAAPLPPSPLRLPAASPSFGD
jgi:hypothetical protein